MLSPVKTLAIKVDTQSKYNELMFYLESEKWVWANGNLPASGRKSYWDDFKNHTCICLAESRRKISYASSNYIETRPDTYDIVSFEDFMLSRNQINLNKDLMDSIRSVLNGIHRPD